MYGKVIRKMDVKYTQILEFSDFDSLADCAAMLVKRRIPCPQSRLYRIHGGYRLLIHSGARSDWRFCHEFCNRQSRSALEAAYTEEHGVLLLANHAVRRIGKAFMKGSSSI